LPTTDVQTRPTEAIIPSMNSPKMNSPKMNSPKMNSTDTESTILVRTRSLPAAIAHLAKNDAKESDITAALGLGLSIIKNAEVKANATELAQWFDRGLDANLIPTARHFGLFIRELHPARAAVGLTSAAEFQQHFDASYAPLIRRALENNQPVLAWANWLPNNHRCWGIITNTTTDAQGFTGIVPALNTEFRMFDSPATQIYVAERIEASDPNPQTTRQLAAIHTSAFDTPEIADPLRLKTGPDAYEEWIDAVDQGIPTAVDCSALAETLIYLRESTERILKHSGNDSRETTRLQVLVRQARDQLLGLSRVSNWANDEARSDAANQLRHLRELESQYPESLKVL
jgi:hypothetical protein